MTDLKESPAPSLDAARKPRLWPALLILAVGGIVVVAFRFQSDWPYQMRNLRTAVALISILGALILWLLAFSRLPWTRRLLWFAGFLGVVGLFAGLFRIRGVSGDLVPEWEFRWKSTTAAAHSAGASTPASEAQTNAWKEARFPQFLGPSRNGRILAPEFSTNWVKSPPRLLWRVPVGPAWSGFAVDAGRAVTQEQEGPMECVSCFDLQTGQRLWKQCVETRYFTTIAGEGPRATPTLSGNRVYAFGATGRLLCLGLMDGSLIWQKDLKKDVEASVPDWGFTSSPLVTGDLVIVSVGGSKDRSLVALSAQDGSMVWAAGDDPPGYSSPMMATLHGEEQVIVFNDHDVVGHALKDGAVRWKHRWKRGHPHVAMPVMIGTNRLAISSGYGTGSQLIEVQHEGEKWSARTIWRTTKFRSKFSNPVELGGFLYGLDDGVLACQELEEGELKWKGERYGHGQVLLAGDYLIVNAEDGRVLLLMPSPREPTLIGSFQALSGKCWNPPALAGRFYLVRHETEAACFQLP
ncbi:MAG: hypothetical protein FJ405_04300 [Verrucomicrobia bacterium]|nr:hypothetical protein [Verrucomicrobiota bacterium]